MLCLAMALMALVQADPKDKEIEAKLKNLRLTIDFKDATLDALADYLRDVADLNIVISAKVEKRDGITIKVTDLPLKSILGLVLKPRDLMWIVKDGVLTICTKIEDPVVLEIYDVRDLLYSPPDFPGVEKTLEGAAFDDPPMATTTVEFPLEELVKGHTGGKSWDEPGRTIMLSNGLLVVKQTKAAHAQIRRMLGELRKMK